MEERTLRALAVFCSLFGLILLFLVLQKPSPTPMSIDGLMIGDVGMDVYVCGDVVSPRTSKNHIFFDIEEKGGRIKVVIFNTTALVLNKSGTGAYSLKNKSVCLEGKIGEYPPRSGEIEIVYRGGKFEVS